MVQKNAYTCAVCNKVAVGEGIMECCGQPMNIIDAVAFVCERCKRRIDFGNAGEGVMECCGQPMKIINVGGE